MKAAVVQKAGASPVYTEFCDPRATHEQALVRVTASSLSHVTRARASSGHYSASGVFPLVPGIDGTGVLEDGTRIYFLMPESPFGGMAEYCLIEKERFLRLPDDIDDATAAAIAIPGMSSWAAFVERAKLVPGETVLINGATGASGTLAVQIAKHLGAKKVIATGRDTAALNVLQQLGADVVISLLSDAEALQAEFQQQFEAGIDVVLDYLWGASAETLLIAAAKAAPDGVPIRYVDIGAISGGDITLPSAVIRSTAVVLMGSGIGSIPRPRIVKAIADVLTATVPAHLTIAKKVVPLAQVERYWNETGSRERIVFSVT